jgi:hypothetical protein
LGDNCKKGQALFIPQTSKRDRPFFSPKRSTADNTDSADMKTGVGGSWRESAEEADFTTKGTKIFTRDTRKVRIGSVGLGDNCKKGQALFVPQTATDNTDDADMKSGGRGWTEDGKFGVSVMSNDFFSLVNYLG